MNVLSAQIHLSFMKTEFHFAEYCTRFWKLQLSHEDQKQSQHCTYLQECLQDTEVLKLSLSDSSLCHLQWYIFILSFGPAGTTYLLT